MCKILSDKISQYYLAEFTFNTHTITTYINSAFSVYKEMIVLKFSCFFLSIVSVKSCMLMYANISKIFYANICDLITVKTLSEQYYAINFNDKLRSHFFTWRAELVSHTGVRDPKLSWIWKLSCHNSC